MTLSVLMPVGGDVETDPWRWRAFEWLVERYKRLLPAAELVFGTSDQEPFNRSQARNDAFARSTGDMLLIADADTVFNPAQIFKANQLIQECGAPWVIPYQGHENNVDAVSREIGRYYNLSQKATAYILDSPPESELQEPPDAELYEHKLTSWAGLLVLPRKAWEAVGGYDENFIGWGYEDGAFRTALDHKVGPFMRVTGPAGYVMHLWHPAPEEQCFGQPFIERNRTLCRKYEIGDLP